jgi:glycosyltransferase involved in cell wall biosynthesis
MSSSDYIEWRDASLWLRVPDVQGSYCIPYIQSGRELKLAVPWEEMRSRGLGRLATWVAHRTTCLLCRCADVVISVTPGIGEELQRQTGMAPQRFVTVQNAADPAQVCDGDGAKVRASLGIEEDDFVVGFVGTFDVWHGTQELVASIEQLDEDIRDSTVYILAGDGECWQSTRDAAAQHGRHAVFPGTIRRSDIRDWLAAFDLGVFVTHDDRKLRYGTSPLKFWEYLAAGLPVLVTEDPNLSPIVREYDMGLIISNASPQSIARAMKHILARREAFHAIGQRNADWASRRGFWSHACQKVEAVLRGS